MKVKIKVLLHVICTTAIILICLFGYWCTGAEFARGIDLFALYSFTVFAAGISNLILNYNIKYK